MGSRSHTSLLLLPVLLLLLQVNSINSFQQEKDALTDQTKVYFDVVDRLTRKVMDNSLIFNIRISDVNDHTPQFPEKEFNTSAKEHYPAGQPIFQMLTVDLDEENTPNSQVLYFLISQTLSLKDSGFQIDHISGEIQLSGCLDYETAPWFTLLVGAKDFREPPLTSTASVHVNVQEGNNHRPTFTQENPLDYETHPIRSLVITVENEEPLFPCEAGQVQGPWGVVVSTTVSVQVMDTNDPPAFYPRSFVVSEVDGARPGIQLGIFNATDPDRAAGQI
ncbi:hypothetical protein GH733_012750, partial [Mirounga leonina]